MLKRLLCLIVAPVLVIAFTAPPASAEVQPDFHWNPDFHIFCPLPWVDTAIVPGSFCVELRGNFGGYGWYGAFSTGRPTWVDSFPKLDGLWCTLADVRGTDGVVGYISTWGLLDLGGYGKYRPGMQYAYYGLQAIGRPGLYRPYDNQFYPHEGWHTVSGNAPIPDVPLGCG